VHQVAVAGTASDKYHLALATQSQHGEHE